MNTIEYEMQVKKAQQMEALAYELGRTGAAMRDTLEEAHFAWRGEAADKYFTKSAGICDGIDIIKMKMELFSQKLIEVSEASKKPL